MTKCNACGESFSGLGYFDTHRTGAFTNEHPSYGRRCLSTEEMEAMGWRQGARGWHDPVAAEKLRRHFAAKALF